MSLFKKMFSQSRNPERKTTLEDSNKNNDSFIAFDNQRYMGRLYGFSWAIIETRDKSYNGEDLKKQPVGVVAIMATSFASKEENDVLLKLLELLDKSPKSENDKSAILGALEGKQVVYKGMPCTVLLEEKEIE